MLEMFEEMNEFLVKKGMKDKVNVKFIDVMEDDLTGYENEVDILNQGYPLPITFIEKQAAFAGKVDNQKLYSILKRF
ncbi:hypothetical protein HYG86_11270 [Alkalicella caledoniensis]|uniref:Glutaredoxin n=1 Tax=Alkalicella caledoniensis TaxID=2731377 RepID=A0A7G9W9E0_ALKCA|nr:hypothetical protein [Alkalicella caledoniensis]QNO15302.1 hypothetical protein HYG86_11270 [Alkalicella caledoniensis]